MYEQLCLKNPEKIALFEAKINNLKKKMTGMTIAIH